MVIYIITKFGDDWLIFVDARVLTRKLWTDGHLWTVSDHNSSLSTLCSGELIQLQPMRKKLDTKPLTAKFRLLRTVRKKPFENILGKEEM